jgi:5-methylcytosine-specific restriction endonuclease McrA
MKKICHKCGIEKDLSEFHKHKNFKDGHVGQCKKCVLARHKEKELEYRKAHNKWVANHEEQWKTYVKGYNEVYRKTEKGIQKHKTANQKYAHTERGRIVINLKTARRRARSRLLINDITPDQVIQILESQNRKCKICDKPFTDERRFELDHITPVSKSKPGDPGLTFGNVQLLCRGCNAEKNNRV